MKNIWISKTLFLAVTAFISSCSIMPYTPMVSLDVSPRTINKSLAIETLKDKAPQKDKKKPLVGYSATSSLSLINDLETEVTSSIVYDFAINQVFEDVGRKVDAPDYIMKGEITRYMGKTRLTTIGVITLASWIGVYTWLLGIPTHTNIVEIELTVSIFTKEGKLMGKYTGSSKNKKRSSIYRNIMLSLPVETNRSLSNAVQEIREKILADIEKYHK